MLNSTLKNQNHSEWESIAIVNARTGKEKQAIYRFRYQVHVGELSRSISSADHSRKRITDQLDSWSQQIYAECHGQIVGAARVTIGSTNDFPDELVQALQMKKFRDFLPHNQKISLVTKLIVDTQYRKTPVAFRLMAKCYEMVREHQSQFSFGGCSPYLIPMYEQLGYRRYTEGFQDPGYGFVIPILLLPEDVEHLTAVRSPFLRTARKLPNSPAARQWLLANIYDSTKYPVSLLTSQQERWDYVASHLGDPLVAMLVLGKLSREEARGLLQIATPFECRQGQVFIRQGDVCNELNILITGEMSVTDGEGCSWLARPGDVVGGVGLLGQTHHQFDIRAVRDCEILAVSRFPFEKLLRTRPGLAEKLDLVSEQKEGR
ncbi:MAG: GNAT family N-acetyltransferase [Negativicutes bacterium]|nr:GNAT family N-acetyltransferase [Negativicutes bacterium]